METRSRVTASRKAETPNRTIITKPASQNIVGIDAVSFTFAIKPEQRVALSRHRDNLIRIGIAIRRAPSKIPDMDLDAAKNTISRSLSKTDSLLHRTAFDEWMIVNLVGLHREVLHYSGSRPQSAQNQFTDDLRPLGRELIDRNHRVGNVDFVPDGDGPAFDVLLTLGVGLFAILNDTQGSTTDLRQLPAWQDVEHELIRLGDAFLADPLAL